MFHSIGSFTPTAILTDIGLFFDKDQLHQFGLASPRTNGLFKRYRMMAYKKVEIRLIEKNKLSIELEDSNGDGTKHMIHIDTDKEDVSEKMAILFSTCRSIDEFFGFGYSLDELNWEDFIINEQLMELMLKIEIKKVYLEDCSISAPLPLFLKFLYRHGKILTLESVSLPSELVSNKTLSLISAFRVHPMEDTNLVVDVNDEFLEGNNTEFVIDRFFTKFTINGISAFVQKIGYRGPTSFGILASDQMQDAIDFERDHHNDGNDICLMSNDGQKELKFNVIIGMEQNVTFAIDLETTDTDQPGMVPIPNNLFGIVAHESFLKFNKICSNPEELLPVSQYQMDRLCIDYEDCVLIIEYTIRGENMDICFEKTVVTLKDTHKIIAEILRNCISINHLHISTIKLDEDFYNLLKPIAYNIHVPEWSIESALEPESLREVQEANSGLFATINLQFPEW